MFRVESPVRSYWRLTSLEDFDGTHLVVERQLRVERRRAPAVGRHVGRRAASSSRRITISALAAIWLPSAYEPRRSTPRTPTSATTRSRPPSSSTTTSTTSDGLTYQVTSRRLASRRRTVGTADEVPGYIRDDYLDLPEDFSPQVRELATQVIGRRRDAGRPGPRPAGLPAQVRVLARGQRGTARTRSRTSCS